MNKCLLLILPLLLLCVPVHANTINIYPIYDASVSNTSATKNYGIDDYLIVSQQSNMAWRSYIFFNNISLIPATATDVTASLKIYAASCGSFGTKQWNAYNTSQLNSTGGGPWEEGTVNNVLCGSNCNLNQNITWANQPNMTGAILQDNITITSGSSCAGWKSFNVTNALKTSIANGNLSLMLKADVENPAPTWTLGFMSKEYVSGNIEYVEVNYSYSGCPVVIPNGTWCNDYNWTVACNYDGTQNATPCWNVYGNDPVPNPYNESRNSFTTFRESSDTDCGIIVGSCPSGYSCVQTWNATRKAYDGKVMCWNGQTAEWIKINETGYNYSTGQDGPGHVNTNLTCTTPDPLDFTNQFSCLMVGCHWCVDSKTCTHGDWECRNCQNSTSVCYDSNCLPVRCTITQATQTDNYTDQIVLTIGSWLNVRDLGTSRMLSSILFTILLTIGMIAAMSYFGIKGTILGQSFLMGFMIFLVMFTFIGWFPSWLMIILMVISSVLVAKTLKVF